MPKNLYICNHSYAFCVTFGTTFNSRCHTRLAIYDKKHIIMKKRYYATLLAALSFLTIQAQETPTIITEAPKGTVYNLCRSTTGFESFYGNAMAHESNGDWQRLVFG